MDAQDVKKASAHAPCGLHVFASAQPLRLPKKTAISVERSVEQTPMIRESLPPDQIIAKISRPIVSVPKRWLRLGARLQEDRSM